jgi:3-methyl-2-oxobutanoate hydroxymethyltransferase
MRRTINYFQKMCDHDKKIVMITAYDYTSASIVEKAGIEIVLVGDSLGQVVLGYDSTVPVTMDDMIRHIQMVVRGTQNAHIVGDLPFMSYQVSIEEALRNAGKLLKEGGCQSVKLEGGVSSQETVEALVRSGIPVMGHIGLTPQSVNQLSGYKIRGRTEDEANQLMCDAIALEKAGAYAVVLELLPSDLSNQITNKLRIPTIGIGAGPSCSGQVQVFHDILGLFPDFVPKHAKRYSELGMEARRSVSKYASDVRSGEFPSSLQSC